MSDFLQMAHIPGYRKQSTFYRSGKWHYAVCYFCVQGKKNEKSTLISRDIDNANFKYHCLTVKNIKGKVMNRLAVLMKSRRVIYSNILFVIYFLIYTGIYFIEITFAKHALH